MEDHIYQAPPKKIEQICYMQSENRLNISIQDDPVRSKKWQEVRQRETVLLIPDGGTIGMGDVLERQRATRGAPLSGWA